MADFQVSFPRERLFDLINLNALFGAANTAERHFFDAPVGLQFGLHPAGYERLAFNTQPFMSSALSRNKREEKVAARGDTFRGFSLDRFL